MKPTTWLGSALALSSFGILLSTTASSAPLATGTAQSGKGEAAYPRQVTLKDLGRITEEEALAHPQPPEPGSIPDYDELKAELAKLGGVGLSNAPPPVVRPPTETPGAFVSFPGLDKTCSNLIPSDMALATDGNFVVQVINACIVVYNNAGVVQPGFPVSTNNFLGLPANAFTFDPRATYDWVQNRFIVVIDEYDNNVGTMWVAVSATPNPTLGWNIYGLAIPGGGATFGDYPSLGQDRQAIYVGMNRFNPAVFTDAAVLYLPKGPMYAGAAFTYWFSTGFNAGGQLVDTIQPANVMNLADNPRAEIMVNSFNINGNCRPAAPCNGLVVWAVSNPLDAPGTPGPEVSGVVIPTANNYTFPPNAQQPGCAAGLCLLNTLDNRISGSVVYSAGSVWGALETAGAAGNPGATMVWFQVRPFLNDGNNVRCAGAFTNLCADIFAAELLNEDCYFCAGRGANGSNYYGTLQPDPEGNVTMVYNYSDANVFPGTAYVSRRVTQQKNSMHDQGVFLLAGTAFYQVLDNFNRNRWGDYTGSSPDLSNPRQPAMWFSGEWSAPVNLWKTQIGGNQFVLPSDL